MKLTKEIVLYKEGGLTEAANKAIANYDQNTLNQAAVFNKLTNNGTIQGIYMQDGSLYINASFIKSGTLVLGGANNGNGVLQIRNASNQVIGTFDRTGVSTSSLTASDYINIAGNATSYFKTPFGNSNDQYVELSTNGFLYHGTRCDLKNSIRNISSLGIVNGIEMTYSGDQPVTDYSNFIAPYAYNMETRNSEANSIFYLTPERINYSKYYADTQKRFSFIVNIASHNKGGVDLNGGINLTVSGSASVSGNFNVGGTKNRLVKTDDYSKRLLYSYETATPYFGDIGEGVIGRDGLCYVSIDPILAETIELDRYQVFAQPYGENPVYITERTPGYFVAKGTPGDSFGWEIKAKQAGYDQRRLNNPEEEIDIGNTIDYGSEAIKYIAEIKEGRAA